MNSRHKRSCDFYGMAVQIPADSKGHLSSSFSFISIVLLGIKIIHSSSKLFLDTYKYMNVFR